MVGFESKIRRKNRLISSMLIIKHFCRFRSDRNEDKTLEVLYQWLAKSADLYHHVNIEYDNSTKRHKSESSQFHWSTERYLHVIELKEEALNYARNIWADYIFVNIARN